MSSLVLCEINSTHNPTQTNQPTTRPYHNTMTYYPCQYFRAAQKIRPSRWASKSWNRAIFKQLLRSYPGLFCVFLLMIGISLFFFEQKPYYFYHIHFTGRNTPYRKTHNTRTMCTTPLQSILEAGLYWRQSLSVRLTYQFGAFFNPKNASRDERYK